MSFHLRFPRPERWRATTASADSVNESTWIVVAVGIAAVTFSLIAIRGSPGDDCEISKSP